MALPGMLSALRELIKDRGEIPADEASRRAAYREWFPSLSSDEVEDLVKIPGERLKIYTKTVFNGEGSTLALHLPMTVARLKQIWRTVNGEPWSLARFSRELHRLYPWRSNRSADLLENVSRFLLAEGQALVTAAPDLSDLIRLERRTLEVRRDLDDQLEAASGTTVKRLLTQTIGELIEQNFVVPRCARFESFAYDVVSAQDFFRANEKELPPKIECGQIFATGSRNRNRFPRWETVPEYLFSMLNQLPRSTLRPISELAESCVVNEATGMEEADAARLFLERLAPLVKTGIVVLPLDQS